MEQTAEARFLPPVHKHEWHTEQAMTGAELAEDAHARFGLDSESWQRILWHGGLHINKRRVDESALPERVSAQARVVVYRFEREPEAVPLSSEHVILKTDDVVVVNKPPWLTVQGTRASNRFSLETQVKELVGAEWITPAHRLDRQTSGVIVFALSSAVARALHKQFEARTVEKNYAAWVRPRPRADAWDVDGFMTRVEHPRHAFLSFSEQPCPGGRSSQTRFELLEAAGEFALVRAYPRTGRTHQIRVHLAHGGTPIVGDQLYGEASPDAERLLLHAQSIRLVLPAGPTTLAADLPPDFITFTARVRGLATDANPC